MASLISKTKTKKILGVGEKTHEGAEAARLTPEEALRRSVMSCLLWEQGAYESGVLVADRIATLVPQVEPEVVMNIAIEARESMKLRHAPLHLAVEMTKHDTHKPFVANTVARIIQRPDELAEILAIYAKDREGVPVGEAPHIQIKKLNKLSKQLRIGVARAFMKFSEYQLAKWS